MAIHGRRSYNRSKRGGRQQIFPGALPLFVCFRLNPHCAFEYPYVPTCPLGLILWERLDATILLIPFPAQSRLKAAPTRYLPFFTRMNRPAASLRGIKELPPHLYPLPSGERILRGMLQKNIPPYCLPTVPAAC